MAGPSTEKCSLFGDYSSLPSINEHHGARVVPQIAVIRCLGRSGDRTLGTEYDFLASTLSSNTIFQRQLVVMVVGGGGRTMLVYTCTRASRARDGWRQLDRQSLSCTQIRGPPSLSQGLWDFPLGQ